MKMSPEQKAIFIVTEMKKNNVSPSAAIACAEICILTALEASKGTENEKYWKLVFNEYENL